MLQAFSVWPTVHNAFNAELANTDLPPHTLDPSLMTILETSERDLYQMLDKVSRTIFIDLLVNRVSSSFLWIKSRSKIHRRTAHHVRKIIHSLLEHIVI